MLDRLLLPIIVAIIIALDIWAIRTGNSLMILITTLALFPAISIWLRKGALRMSDYFWLPFVALDIWAIWIDNSFLILVTSLALILALSIWLSNYWSLAGVEFSRCLSNHRAYFGQQIDLSLKFLNLKLLPLTWLLVEDEVPKRLTIEKGKIETKHDGLTRLLRNFLPMMPYERVIRHFRVTCNCRGIHSFGPAYIQSGDYLGLRKSYMSVSTTDTLVIFPRIAPIALSRLSSNQIIGRDPIRRILHTDPVRTVCARKYVAGDPYRLIDWRTTARTDDLMVRVFEPSTTPLVDIIVNFSVPSSLSRDDKLDTAEFMISIGASLAAHAAEKGWSVGLRANGISGSNPIALAASAAPAQLGEILDILARADNTPSESILSVLTSSRPARPAGACIVLITTVLNEKILGTLHDLNRRGWPVTVVYTAARSDTGMKSSVPVWHLPYSPDWTVHEAYIVNE